MKRLVVLSICMGLAGPASGAGFDTGNSLYSDCQKNELSCVVIAGAYLDMMTILGYKCRLNENVTRGQVKDVLSAYLQAHPEQRHHSLASLAVRAFEEAFACRRGQ
jgi:Ssp1 endopeptidase immunity protein Rap1a